MRAFLVAISLFSAAHLGGVVMAATPKIMIEEDPTLLTSTIYVVVRGGAEEDPAKKAGLSNFVAQLVLRGTKSKSRSQFQSELERMGGALSVSASHDMLVFTGRVIREKTPEFMKLLGEALERPALSAKEFKSLKTEILADLNDEKNSNVRLSGLAMRRAVFAGTAMERPVAGTLGSVKGISLRDVQHLYKTLFKKGNFVFAAASARPESELNGELAEIWNRFPAGELPIAKSIAPQIPRTPQLIVVQKPKTSTGAFMMAQPGITAQDAERYTLSVGNFSFGSEPLVARLFRIIRGQLGWTYSIGSTYHATGSLSYQQGLFVISATPSVEFTVKTILKSVSMWREYYAGGLKGPELKLAQESLINSYPFEFDSPEKRLWQKLYSYLYSVPLLSPEEYAKTINGVTNKKLLDAISTRHTREGWLIALVADKAQIEKQLEAEQKDVPKDQRLTISKVLTPEQVVE